MEAVILSFEEYEYLHNHEELFEHMEIKAMLEERLIDYNPDKNTAWDKIREDI